MASQQHFSSANPSGRPQESQRRPSSLGGNAQADRHADESPSLSELMEARRHYPVGQWGALLLLGFARTMEWQAAAGHVAISEWSRQQQEWLSTVIEMEYGFRHLGLSRSHLERTFDVARLWGLWGVTTQLATAQGLVSSCTPQSLGLPADSGRRAGFDLGRRATTGAVVIDFPDRRRVVGAAGK